MRRLIMILAFTAIAAGCCYDIDEILLEREDISFTMKGEDLFKYNPLTCQMSYSSSDNTYRIYDDLLSDWIVIKCSSRPDTEGQELTVDLNWTASSSTRSESDLQFTVQKTSEDGRIWLWNKSKRIGIVIKNL